MTFRAINTIKKLENSYKFANIPKRDEWSQRNKKYKLHYSEVYGYVLRPPYGTNTNCYEDTVNSHYMYLEV